MIPPDVKPIGHVPPLPAIDIAPRHPITPAEAKTCWEIEADQIKEQRRAQRAEVIWKLVRQVAEGTNMPSRQPVDVAIGIPMAAKSEPEPEAEDHWWAPGCPGHQQAVAGTRAEAGGQPIPVPGGVLGGQTYDQSTARPDSNQIAIAFGTAWKSKNGVWVQVDPETGREVGEPR